jgi:hypothetical protein
LSCQVSEEGARLKESLRRAENPKPGFKEGVTEGEASRERGVVFWMQEL